jgi:hypothetical protein
MRNEEPILSYDESNSHSGLGQIHHPRPMLRRNSRTELWGKFT